MLHLLGRLIFLYEMIVFVRIIFTWIPVNPWSNTAKFVNVLERLTDPVLAPLRRIIPPIRAGAMAIDLSPMILLFVLSLLSSRL